jgi:hypothetical protein
MQVHNHPREESRCPWRAAPALVAPFSCCCAAATSTFRLSACTQQQQQQQKDSGRAAGTTGLDAARKAQLVERAAMRSGALAALSSLHSV